MKKRADEIRRELLYRPEPNCLWDTFPTPVKWVVAVAAAMYFGGGTLAFLVGMSRLH